MSAHICPNRPHDHTTATALVRVDDNLSGKAYESFATGPEHGHGRVGKEKRDRVRVPAGVYANLFYAVMLAMGLNPSREVVLGPIEAKRTDLPEADLDRFTNDSTTGRFTVTCGWCGAHLSKVGYGPGLVIVCPKVINGSGLTNDPELARLRDEAGAAALEAHARRVN
jgi:hypothetical protein